MRRQFTAHGPQCAQQGHSSWNWVNMFHFLFFNVCYLPLLSQKRFLYQRLSPFPQSWSWAACRLCQHRLPLTVKFHELKCGGRRFAAPADGHHRSSDIFSRHFSRQQLIPWISRTVDLVCQGWRELIPQQRCAAFNCWSNTGWRSEQNVRCMKKTAAVWSVSCTGVNCRGRQNNV